MYNYKVVLTIVFSLFAIANVTYTSFMAEFFFAVLVCTYTHKRELLKIVMSFRYVV